MIIPNPNPDSDFPEKITINQNRTTSNLWIRNWEFWESLKTIQREESVQQEKQHSTTTSGIAA